MNIYDAIMKAAQHIERNPNEFHWMSCRVPRAPHCGTPGCALGWIGTFADALNRPKTSGYEAYDGISLVADSVLPFIANPILPIGQAEFYERMREVGGSGDWKRSAAECARVLRLYAKQYHAPKVRDWNAIAAKQTVGENVRSQELA